MVRFIAVQISSLPESALLTAIGLFIAVSVVVFICAKHERKSESDTRNSEQKSPLSMSLRSISSLSLQRSPLPSPKKLMNALTSSSVLSLAKKKNVAASGDRYLEEKEAEGLWQKNILMGEKCQPPDFTGVIFYNNDGKQQSALPQRSPRWNHMNNFAYPVYGESNSVEQLDAANQVLCKTK